MWREPEADEGQRGWIDSVEEDLQEKGLMGEEYGDRARWKGWLRMLPLP